MRVEVLRPHRNDHLKDDGKPGWKHTGTGYEHPDPAEDIKRGLVKVADDNPVQPADPPDPAPEKATALEPAQKEPAPKKAAPKKAAPKKAAPKKAAPKKAAPKKAAPKKQPTKPEGKAE